MNKLNKQHLTERDEICAKLREALEQLEVAVNGYNSRRAAAWSVLSLALNAYNTEMDDAWMTVEAARDEYGGQAQDARDWASGIAGEIEEYMGERSDKWSESDKGQAVSSWKDEFDSAALQDIEIESPGAIEIEEPEDLSIDEENAAEVLEQLPEEVEC